MSTVNFRGESFPVPFFVIPEMVRREEVFEGEGSGGLYEGGEEATHHQVALSLATFFQDIQPR